MTQTTFFAKLNHWIVDAIKSNIWTEKNLYELKSKLFSKDSPIHELQLKIKSKDCPNKREIGILLKDAKQKIQAAYLQIEQKILEQQQKSQQFNYSLLPTNQKLVLPSRHLLLKTCDEIRNIFFHLGFSYFENKEIVTVKYNFDLLNFPKLHPGRLENDSIYINSKSHLLRTHCTTVSAWVLEKLAPNQNIAMYTIGNVYRPDTDDATHSHQFMQLDVVYQNKIVTINNLLWILEEFCSRFFERKIHVSLRHSFFPFTKPSFEVDITCIACNGKGCDVCKKSGVIEVLGCGMLDPRVLKNCGHNPQKVQALAFGVGIERLAMLKYAVTDIRHFYANDLKSTTINC